MAGGSDKEAQQARSRHSDGGPVIDIHAHWHAPDFVALLEKEGNGNGAKIGKNDRGFVTLQVPGINSVFQRQYIDLGTRLKAMDAAGVNIHALSLTSPMVYWAPPAFGLRLSQVYNDSLVKAHRQYPQRFVGLATLPMQDPGLALQELDRAAKLPGIRGVYLATHVNGTNLDEERFFPVYARCEELGLPIFLHPVNPVGADRVVLGSDHPADMGCGQPVVWVNGLTELPPRDHDLMLGANAARLLKI